MALVECDLPDGVPVADVVAPLVEVGVMNLFASMMSFVISAGVRVDRVPFDMALVPLARFVRWRLTNPGGSGDWDATFRLWATAIAYQ